VTPDRLENAPCGFVEFTDEGVITYANATLTVWLGEIGQTLAGRKVESIMTVANRIFFQTHLFPLLKLQGRAEEIFLNLRRTTAIPLPVIASAQRRFISGVAVISCVFVTVYQRRQYEDEILQAKAKAEEALHNNEALQAAKSEAERRSRELERSILELRSRNNELQRVSQILSHDLREPVRKIALFADLIKNLAPPNTDPEATDALERIYNEAAQSDKLLTAIRQFLEADASTGPEPLKLDQLVEKCSAEVGIKLAFSDWKVELESLPDVIGHRAPVQRLFSHLLENAIKFRDRNRQLTVKVTGRLVQQNVFQATKDRYTYVDFARIEFQDNGSGFDPKYHGYVFQLLKKIDLASPGLGVGLAICRKVAEVHYGSISVESTPGVGTIFIILLPVRP
jgi:phosphoserine phosphatase RsbU/P